MAKGLSERESKCYRYIIDFITANNYCPSVESIRLAMNYKSKSTVHDVLVSLEDKGYIKREKYESRSIKINGYSFRKNSVSNLIKVPDSNEVFECTECNSFVDLSWCNNTNNIRNCPFCGSDIKYITR